MAWGMKLLCVVAWGRLANWPMGWPANSAAGEVVDIIANSCIMRLWLLLRCALFAATCCMDALKMTVFTSFDVVDCERTVAERLTM
jgi:hypothetical protein